MSSDAERRLSALERRVAELEDERAVARLVASYGPLVDSGSAEAVAALWEPGGSYDVDELVLAGHEDIAAMVRSTAHQRWIDGGCAHLVGPPQVTVSGAEATAICHSLMVVRTGGRFRVHRATANRWRLRKGPDGWRVTTRTNRVLDGRVGAPALLAEAQPPA
ncbi:nuclear transport factor 2 family protein [Saccharopolyspora cebuensis]|uniref:Nuclear transport factor 2 family protein n=1 Tax=Saccharopolyspora cebuensis TaxID=418759 RepID=A0ABV4CJ31_9PSEU